MTPNEYQRKAVRTARNLDDIYNSLVVGGLGLTGEAGEVADHIKKGLFHDHGIDAEHLVKELGDVLWYVALLCEALGVGIEHVMDANIRKLQARYPNGFSPERSRNRTESVVVDVPECGYLTDSGPYFCYQAGCPECSSVQH